MELPELKGYLRKKSRQDRWQKRYFEATTHYLTYYKSKESEKLLACIDLWRTQGIELNTNDPQYQEFSISIGEQSYLLKAETSEEALKWVNGLKARQHRPEGVPSEAFSLRSERYDIESNASGDVNAIKSRQYAASETESTTSGTSTCTSTVGKVSLISGGINPTYTDTTENPIVPNAKAIAAGRHPMLDSKTTRSSTTSLIEEQKEEPLNPACCAPCQMM